MLHGIEAVYHGGIERRKQGGVKKIENIGDRGAKPFDLPRCQFQYHFFQDTHISRIETGEKKLAKSLFVDLVFVDIRNAQLGFPVEGMGRALENLFLLGDAGQHEFQR